MIIAGTITAVATIDATKLTPRNRTQVSTDICARKRSIPTPVERIQASSMYQRSGPCGDRRSDDVLGLMSCLSLAIASMCGRIHVLVHTPIHRELDTDSFRWIRGPVYKTSYDNAKVTINFQRTSNLQNVLRKQAFKIPAQNSLIIYCQFWGF